MPELPEVESAARGLRGWLDGARITRLEALDARVLRGDPAPLTGARVVSVERAGKHLFVQTAEHALHVHLGMTGRFVRGGAPRFARLRLRVGRADVWLDDARRLGQAWVQTPAEVAKVKKKLGPDALGVTSAVLRARFEGDARPLKIALMDQARVAGLGNIHAAEALFRARLDPRRATSALKKVDWTRLAEAIDAALRHALATLDPEDVRYVNQGGENPFLVYGREGEPCPRCGAPIAREQQDGRSTYYCAACVARR